MSGQTLRAEVASLKKMLIRPITGDSHYVAERLCRMSEILLSEVEKLRFEVDQLKANSKPECQTCEGRGYIELLGYKVKCPVCGDER